MSTKEGFNQRALDLAVCIPEKKTSGISTQHIAYIAMLSAVCVVLNIFTMSTEVFAISFVYIPTFIAGYFIGPVAGLLTGLIGDGLGCIIAPKGPWIPEILLASGLLGLIPGLVKKYLKKQNIFVHLAVSFVVILVICTAGLNTFGLWRTYASAKKTFWVYFGGRVPLELPVVTINAAMLLILAPVMEKALKIESDKS